MDYSLMFRLLNQHFNFKDPEIFVDNLNLTIRNHTFTSEHSFSPANRNTKKRPESPILFHVPDDQITENKTFRFSIIQKSNAVVPHKKAIVMLHGLNERKWAKYLPWAAYLTEHTGAPVILFPISFHMNRAPESWSNPRILLPLVKRKMADVQLDELTTIANYALSERLNESPARFFLSGYQSINDVTRLLTNLKSNQYGGFDPDLTIDFFAYSIGAFLTEVLMIANPDHLIDQSKFFFFCGGAIFSGMDATSKFILNKSAQQRINHYYLHELENETAISPAYREILTLTGFGRAFRAMIAPERFRSIREKAIQRFSSQIKAIGLKKDFVIPPREIYNTVKGFSTKSAAQFEMLDFDYPYSHESPFDAKLTRFTDRINAGFDQVFLRAASFLSH